ncbi:S1/P1 nuclease [Hymenobacter algoricola]|uniref:S1/P1 nuclease n=1 Tax=Hymenobacter algoricola TaxID=486267 RepID=A0ABP7NN33_9BACT
MPKRLLPLLFLTLTPLRLWAWGMEGHRAVAQIAEQHLSAGARHEIATLLGTETLTMISTWPDEIRYYPGFKGTAPWHYVNTPAGLNQAQYLQALHGQKEANAYQILQIKLCELEDAASTPAERTAALKFVVHLVGDAHQPLHAGHAEDKGGNDVRVKFRGKDTNLHSLWDSGLLEYQGLSYTEMAGKYSQLPRRQRREWQQTPMDQWFWESYQASEQLYRDTPAGADLDYTYYPAHAQLMQQRIQQAGIRLAQLLNETLG